jgi:hypothetical protein
VRRRIPPVGFSDGEPPQELLRFATRASSASWTADEFAAWLRARAAWRDTHTEPLPGLPGRERCALTRLGLPQALIDAEAGAQ